MKDDIAAIELRHLVAELQILTGAKVDKIYQPEKYSLLFQLHKTGLGKQLLRILVGKLIYLTSKKGDQPQKLPGYCAFLRKYLGSARLEAIEQLESERIVALRFDTKDGKRTLYVEFFTRGNAIFCDASDVIISPLDTKVWADRTIKKGEVYVYPKLQINLFDLNKGGFASILANTKQESLVKCLASELGMGGAYAEEACHRATVEKNEAPNDLATGQVNLLFDAITSIVDEETKPVVVRKKDGSIKTITPFALQIYTSRSELTLEPCVSYNTAFDSTLTPALTSKKEQAEAKVQETKEQKSRNIINAQRKQVRNMERQIDLEQNKGELIYSNYQLIDDLINQVREARKTMSWKEIKEKLKGHDLITDVDGKTGTVTIDI